MSHVQQSKTIAHQCIDDIWHESVIPVILSGRFEFGWPRTCGFQRLEALQCLVVPFYVLMGKPDANMMDDASVTLEESLDWSGFPALQDTLPQNLRSLSLSLASTEILHRSEEYKSLINKVLTLNPSPGQELLLSSFDLYFCPAHWLRLLPLDLSEIQASWHKYGVPFEYNIYSGLAGTYKRGTLLFLLFHSLYSGCDLAYLTNILSTLS